MSLSTGYLYTAINHAISANLLIAIQDQKNRYVWATQAAIELCGFYSEDDMLGKKSTDMRCSACELGEYFDQQNSEVFQLGSPQQFIRVAGKYANGKNLLTSYEKIPLYENGNQHILTIVTDLTQQMHLSAILNNDYIVLDNKSIQEKEHLRQLTEREFDILFYILHGKSAKETGKILNISYRTVETHLSNIKNKLNVRNQRELIDKSISLNYKNIYQNPF